jgi:hypothetical protein
MTPISLANTRTSVHWTSRRPGNWDRLNTRAIFPAGNEWGIPDLPAALWIPNELIAYNSRRGMARAQPPVAVHFFLDDYRFEFAWNRPEAFAKQLIQCGGALTPDFSLWADMPLAMQLWNVYRNRWLGTWLESWGIRVIPTVGWSTSQTWPFAFEGIAPDSVVAVSTVGVVRDKEARKRFLAGYEEMQRRLTPSLVLCYGKPLPDMQGNIRSYPTRWEAE